MTPEIPNIEKRELILLVTDKELLATQVYQALENNYLISRGRNYAEALSRMTFRLPNLVITDIELPDRTGLDLLRTIRNSIKTKLIPFILLDYQQNQSARTRIEALDFGADDYVLCPFHPEELLAVVQSKLNKFKEFYLLSITDELTRLYNRREFMKKFQDEINNYPERTLSVAILDIDYFKHVNDTYGHQIGDKVLMELAQLLKTCTSDTFFPARFGGEEFVILFPSSSAEAAKILIEELLEDFSLLIFEAGNSRFHVTFSAGISEYPETARNVSELLSRADQALYAAKDEGRSRVYIFSPIMARNDKFWEYLRIRKGMFIDARSNDAVTRLPFLPQLLEVISSLDFTVNSIGILVIKLNPIQPIKKYFGPMNFQYDIENIRIAIEKACELIFPSDTYIGLSDFFSYEFTILFPSVVNFSYNLEKFYLICEDIGKTIDKVLSDYYVDIVYSSGVVSLDKSNPRGIYSAIDAVRTKGRKISSKVKKFAETRALFENADDSFRFLDHFSIRNFYPLDWDGSCLHYFSLNEKLNKYNAFGALIQSIINTPSRLENFLKTIDRSVLDQFPDTMLFNFPGGELWNDRIQFNSYLDVLDRMFPPNNKVILLNEYSLSDLDIENIASLQEDLPSHVSLGLNNCYISNDILSVISRIEFSMILLSESITRNIHYFKDRIKIISGLKMFLDQVGIPLCAKNVQMEEEYQILGDLRISYVSGNYIEKMSDYHIKVSTENE